MSDIVDWLRVVSDSYGMGRCEEALEEIERLRAELEKIAAMDEICVTDFDGVNGWAHQWIARAALAKG